MKSLDEDSKPENHVYSVIIGKELKRIRKNKGFSGSKVASQLGISQQQYSRYECGKCRISIDTLLRILFILDFDFEIFFSELRFQLNNDYHSKISNVKLSNIHKDIESYFDKTS